MAVTVSATVVDAVDWAEFEARDNELADLDTACSTLTAEHLAV